MRMINNGVSVIEFVVFELSRLIWENRFLVDTMKHFSEQAENKESNEVKVDRFHQQLTLKVGFPTIKFIYLNPR